MHEATPNLRPVSPDGDSALRLTGDINAKMGNMFEKGVLPDGSFAMTDMTEQPNGAFTIYSDQSGQALAESLIGGGEEPAAVYAYGERLDLVAHPEKYSTQTLARGESRALGQKPESILVNGAGELGKSNLVGLVTEIQPRQGFKRSHGLVERNGRTFVVSKIEHENGKVLYIPQEVTTGGDKPANIPFETKIKQEDGASLLEVSSDAPGQAELHIPGTERAHEQEKTPRIRGILRAKRDREHASMPKDVELFDVEKADTAIEEELTSQAKMLAYNQQEELRAQSAEQYKQNFEDAINIEKLSQKHPEAGNIFHPGATIFEDKLFVDAAQSLGLGTVEDNGKQSVVKFSERDEQQMRNNPEIRKQLKEVLRKRLDAWVKENPASVIQNYYGADQEIDSHTEPVGLKHGDITGARLDDYAFTNRRTVANMIIPDGVRENRNKSSQKRYRRDDDPGSLGSHRYVVNIAFDMIANDFGDQEHLYSDRRFVDPDNKVMIHTAGIAQHRTTAGILVYGEV